MPETIHTKQTPGGYGCSAWYDMEQELVVFFTTRQDGKTSITVVITEVDGESRAKSMLVVTDYKVIQQVAGALAVTLVPRWTDPEKARALAEAAVVAMIKEMN